MSDAPSSAPATNGPASASDAQLTGRFAEEAKHGYREMAPSAPPMRTETEFATGREAADELVRKRRQQRDAAPEVRPVVYHDEHGRKAPENETVSIERGATDLENSRFTDVVEREMRDRDDIARKVDKLRADAGVPTDPTAPVDPTQVDPHLFGDLPQQAPQIDPAHLPQHMQPAPPGIDPDLHLAFQNPKVRQAVETEVNKAITTAKTAQQHYAENVHAAQEIALGSIYAAFPEMAGVKTQAQMQEVLNRLQQTNPQRLQQAQAMLGNFTRLHDERVNMQRQKQQIEHQNFQHESAVQDAAFLKSVSHIPMEQRKAVEGEVLNYAQSLGIDASTFSHLMQTNPVMRHASFRRMMYDAVSGSLARKQLADQQRKQRAANIPTVQQPGTSNHGGVREVQSANLQTLRQKLNSSGDAKDAAALLIAMRNSRKRN